MSAGESVACASPRKPVVVEPVDTVATLAARIRDERCGVRVAWQYDPETAAGFMLRAAKMSAWHAEATS